MLSFQTRNFVPFVLSAILSLLKPVPALSASSALAAKTAAPIRVSVAQFQDKTASGASYGSGCHGYLIWADRLGEAFSDVLVERLGENPRLEVLEREAIAAIYANEVALGNSEADRSIQKGGFLKAKIAFVGVVDGFEYCESAGGAALNVGKLLGIGDVIPALQKSSASVSVILRAVDTATGRILAQARAKKKQSKSSVALLGSIDGVDFASVGFKQTPLGEAIRAAIFEASDGVLAKLKI